MCGTHGTPLIKAVDFCFLVLRSIPECGSDGTVPRYGVPTALCLNAMRGWRRSLGVARETGRSGAGGVAGHMVSVD